MKTQKSGAASTQPTDVNQLSESKDVISFKPSQALCMHVLKENSGKFVSTYVFRAEGVSHPAGRIQEITEKGIDIDRHYGPAIDEHGNEHARCAYYKLSGGA